MKKYMFDSFEGLQEWMNDKNLIKDGNRIIIDITKLGLEVYLLNEIKLRR